MGVDGFVGLPLASRGATERNTLLEDMADYVVVVVRGKSCNLYQLRLCNRSSAFATL